LHLHPAKITATPVRYSYTWGMGGITFYLFLVLTFTGVLLMFYLPSQQSAGLRDVLYLEHDVPSAIAPQHAPLAAHLMVIAESCTCSACFSPARTKAREFNWNVA